MNKTLISRLVIGALVSIAAGGAYAGQIGAASAPMAREVITSNAVVVSAPTTSYHFAGDIDATTADQTFQVHLTLATKGVPTVDTAASAALWDDSVLPSVDAFQFGTSAGVPIPAAVVTARGFSTDKKTLWVTFTVPVSVGYVTTPTITFNPAGAATTAKVTNLKTVVGDLLEDFTLRGRCDDSKSMPVGILHFKGLTDPMSIATGSVATGGNGNGSADEHTRTNATNEGVAIVFPTDLLVKMTKPVTNNATLATGGNLLFANTGTIAPAATTAFQDANNVLLGNFALTQLGQGYDQDFGIGGSPKYALLSTPTTPVAIGVVGSTLTPVPAGAVIDGTIEVAGVHLDVTASNGFLPGAVVYAVAPGALCNATVTAAGVITPPANLGSYTVLPTDSTTIRLSLDAGTAGVVTALNAGTPIGVCYAVTGLSTIPSSSFSAVGTVVKATGLMGEQNNQCSGPFTSFGGGIKIDVRNYASAAEQANSGYGSVIRLINNSDSRKADVWAQIIHQDGTLGNWGKIADLDTRAVKNMKAADIEALLINAPTAAVGAAKPSVSPAGAPRLRITSTTGTSLRVQNYLLNYATGQILEASGSQAVDYEGNNVQRAPINDGQYISQDANSGLNLQ